MKTIRMNLYSILLILVSRSIYIHCQNETNDDLSNNSTLDIAVTDDNTDDNFIDHGPQEAEAEAEEETPITEKVTETTNGAPYERYNKYPNYCSTPNEMRLRTIPPVKEQEQPYNVTSTSTSTSRKKTRLIQVISIIRHGARTPYSDGMHCWEGYRSSTADTSKWDCNLSTIIAPPTSPSIVSSTSKSPNKRMLIFEKKYDALKTPLGNELNGTCQLGQLLETGYIQELENGQILKDAYFSKDGSKEHMRLFYNTSVLENETHLYTYYRVDDMQRTLMSGQVLLTSLFGGNAAGTDEEEGTAQPISIPIHTTDKLVDILEPNTFTCPKLTHLKEEAYASKEFRLKNTSVEAGEVRSILYDTLKSRSPGGGMEGLDAMVDCFMTTMCSDRTLPDFVDDFDGDESSAASNFMRIINLSTWKWLYVYQYKNAAFSKLAMGPLWADIFERMLIATLNAPTSTANERLVLYSAHDVTIMTLLATLGFDVVSMPIAPYASLLNIELHAYMENAVESTGHAFRLVFNGQVVTSSIPNCPQDEELCDVDILFKLLTPFATRDRDCTVHPTKSLATLSQQSAQSFAQSPILSLCIVLISCVLGGYMTYATLRRQTGLVLDDSAVDDLVLEEEVDGGYGATDRVPGKEVFESCFDREDELI